MGTIWILLGGRVATATIFVAAVGALDARGRLRGGLGCGGVPGVQVRREDLRGVGLGAIAL